MIDLVALATSRAKALAQPESDWLSSVKQKYTEVACTTLSDGEIQQVFALSETPFVLSCLFEGFAEAAEAGESMAFQKWKDHLEQAGITLSEGATLWASEWQKERVFTKCLRSLQKSLPPKRPRPKLELISGGKGKR